MLLILFLRELAYAQLQPQFPDNWQLMQQFQSCLLLSSAVSHHISRSKGTVYLCTFNAFRRPASRGDNRKKTMLYLRSSISAAQVGKWIYRLAKKRVYSSNYVHVFVQIAFTRAALICIFDRASTGGKLSGVPAGSGVQPRKFLSMITHQH